MAVYRLLGSAIVSNAEFQEKAVLGQLSTFNNNLNLDTNSAMVEFKNGKLESDNFVRSILQPTGETTPFQPIGAGKPLTIQMRHLYTGKYPKKGVFDKTKDMLVTSAMKSIATFDAAPRAINFLTKNIKAKHGLSNPAATDKGTPLIHYSPALTETNTVLTLEIGFDEFPDQAFDVVSNALSQAAGIPLFMSASTHLLAASSIMKVAGDIGSRVFDKSPVFKATESLAFSTPGETIPVADFRLIVEDNVDINREFGKYRLSPDGLVDNNGQKYSGETPYVIISLDGARNDNYSEFIPTAASAVILEKFFNIREGQGQTLDPLIDAIKVYNDYKFRRKADDLKEDLDKINNKESEEYLESKKEYDALVENILEDVLKPTAE